ncbi:MAG: acyltransferase [Promethearchaeota archaeon]
MHPLINKIKSSISYGRKPENLHIFEFTKIINPEFLFVGDNVIIDDFCLLYPKEDAVIEIGSWVHIASFTSITGGPVKIGNFCAIASGSRIIAGSDHYANGALMNPPIPEKFRNVSREGCIMEDFSFLSVNTIVFPGVKISEGAVIGAGSIVRKDVDPWGVYIMKDGNMVKIKERDKAKTIQNSIKLKQELNL